MVDLYDVVNYIINNPKWFEKLQKSDRNFWSILPAACRELKVKLTEEQKSRAYQFLCFKLREGL